MAALKHDIHTAHLLSTVAQPVEPQHNTFIGTANKCCGVVILSAMIN